MTNDGESYLLEAHPHLVLDEYGGIDLDKMTNTKLKRAHRLRRTRPRVCATCKHLIMTNGFAACERPDGFEGDAGDMGQWENVCDRWAK